MLWKLTTGLSNLKSLLKLLRPTRSNELLMKVKNLNPSGPTVILFSGAFYCLYNEDPTKYTSTFRNPSVAYPNLQFDELMEQRLKEETNQSNLVQQQAYTRQ